MTRSVFRAAEASNPLRLGRRLLDTLPSDGIARNNAIGTFLMGALPAVAGSAVSFLLNAFFVWAVLSLAVGRFPFRMSAGEKMIATTLSVYAVSILVTALAAVRHVGLIESTLWLLPFFSAWFLVPRLRASPTIDYLFIFCLGASIGAIAGCLLGIVQLLAGDIRPAGGAGNTAIYGVSCLLLGCFSALNVNNSHALVRRLAVAGLLAGLLGTLLSQTRGTWFAAIPALGLVFAYAPARWQQMRKGYGALWLSVFCLAAILITADLFWSRVEYTSSELETIAKEEDFSSSIGERLKLWEASILAITASPLSGYGIQNRMLAIQSLHSALGSGLSPFTHAHNLLLTAFLDGGIIVAVALVALLASPIVIAKNSGSTPEHRKRFYLAVILVATYVTNGMSQIMFKHDIMDSLFIYAALVVAVSAQGGGPAAAARHVRPLG